VLYPEHWRGRAEISDEEVWFLVVLRTETAEIRMILKVIVITYMRWWDSIEKTMRYTISRRTLLNRTSCSISLDYTC